MSNKNNDIPIWRRGDAYPADWPEWLRAADIEWCQVRIAEDGKVIWHHGIWSDGTWHNGDWRAGTWRYGEWHAGTWHNGEWCDGIWYDGEWHGGEWRTGIWRNGHWRGGEWRDGAWFDGRWYGGDWRDGVWCNGVWHRGDWHGGRWLAGGRYDGGWHDGKAWRTDGPPDDSIGENMSETTETDARHDMDLRDGLAAQAELHGEAKARAERLAEALEDLITWIPSADTYRRLGFDPEAPMRALERARTALAKENSND